jgi:microcystin-dependent protein
MSRNGSGIYILPAGNPVVTGTTITSNWANTTLSDISTALTGSVAADGQTPVTGNLQMGGNKITGMADGSALTDAATYGQIVNVNSVISGTIQMWPTVTAPSGYLFCGGSAVSRTTYAVLFSIIGTTFGAGDGSTTFNLPNYTNRMPIGVGSTAALAATGGSKDAIVVSHTHTATVTDPGHIHSANTYNSNANSAGGPNVFDPGSGPNSVTNSAVTGISVSNASTGVSGTNANLPPYIGINFIIKI